ncbi:MAG: sugar ABC transporter permease [Abitibacteriaceae bacterium]|nr:sugar ABC transporter permease [Abditibacteriaceae bacterium]
MTRTEWKQIGKGLAFCSPWLIGFMVFTLIPVVLSLYYSVCDYSLLQPPAYIGGANYHELLDDPIFRKSLTNTLLYAIIALPAGLMVSLGLALLLNVKVAGQTFYRTVIFLPSLVPTVASAMLWMWLFNAKLGLINTVLDWLPFRLLIAGINAILGLVHLPQIETPIGWLTNPAWALPALAFMSFWGVGHTVVIYLAGLQDVPSELLESAEIDGAGMTRRLWHVTLPMLSPVIFFNLIMAIIGTLQVFAIPYIMTGGGPARATYFFTMYLYDNAFRYLKMGYASAMAWIQLLIILALTAIAFWSSRKWVYYQGK